MQHVYANVYVLKRECQKVVCSAQDFQIRSGVEPFNSMTRLGGAVVPQALGLVSKPHSTWSGARASSHQEALMHRLKRSAGLKGKQLYLWCQALKVWDKV